MRSTEEWRSASFRRSSSSGASTPRVWVVLLAMFLIGLAFARFVRNQGSSPGPSAAGGRQGGAAVNPIDRALAAPSGLQPRAGPPSTGPDCWRAGVALAVLLDTSGSMGDSVKGEGGRMQPKIVIARQCLRSLIAQAEAAAREQPDRRIVAGIYEFSGRERQESCRVVMPMGPPKAAAAEAAVGRIMPEGNTPIGDAMIFAKGQLDRAGLSRRHLLVITDGENNHGYALPDVVAALSRLPEEQRPATYFIAFDTATAKFGPVRDAGGLVLSAANAAELQQTLDYVLKGKILAEQPEPPRK